MALLVKDANTTTQSLATQTDAQGNLVPEHVEAFVSPSGQAQPVSATAPLPVIATAGTAASDGSGTVATGGQAQQLFGGATPVNGFQVQNNSVGALWISDVGAAAATGASIQIAASGGIYTTPPGYKPAGPVSLFGATTSQAFAARRW
jgi:hypothetical protein